MMIRSLLLTIFATVVFAVVAPAADTGSELPSAGSLLTKVPFKPGIGRLDAAGRKAVDSVLSEIAKQGDAAFICLQGHSGSGKNRSEYVKRSLNLAKEVETYLRLNKSVSVELYLATQDDKIPPRRGDYVNILVFPAEFRERSGFTQVIGR